MEWNRLVSKIRFEWSSPDSFVDEKELEQKVQLAFSNVSHGGSMPFDSLQSLIGFAFHKKKLGLEREVRIIVETRLFHRDKTLLGNTRKASPDPALGSHQNTIDWMARLLTVHCMLYSMWDPSFVSEPTDR
jgi:hypothetical protein